MENISLEQRTDSMLIKQRVVEAECLKRLENQNIIFGTDSDYGIIAGRLVGIGENYLFLEDVKVLEHRNGIENYLSGNYEIKDKENIIAKKDYAVYNKRDITQMYKI